MTRNQALAEIRRTSQHSKVVSHPAGQDAPSPGGGSVSHFPISTLVKLPGFKYHSLLMGLIVVTVLVRILESMFVVGAIGSFVVLVLSGIEDLKMLLGREEESRS
jgi:hypothetical protein